MGRGERRRSARAPACRSRLLQPRPAGRPGRRRDRRPLRRQGPRLRARVLPARQPGTRGLGRGRRSPPRMPSSSAPATSARCSRRSSATSSNVHEVPPGVDIDEWRPRPRDEALAGLLGRSASRPAEPRQRKRASAGRGQRRAARRVPGGRRADRRLLRQAPLQQGRPRPARGAPRGGRPGGDRRLRRLPRASSRRSPARERSSPDRSSTAISSTCSRSRTSRSCRRSSPRRSGWSPPRRPRPGRPPLVARHSGLAEIADGLEQEYPPHLAHLAAFATGDAQELARKLNELLALPAADREALREAARRATVARWSWAGVAGRLLEPFNYPPADG